MHISSRATSVWSFQEKLFGGWSISQTECVAKRKQTTESSINPLLTNPIPRIYFQECEYSLLKPAMSITAKERRKLTKGEESYGACLFITISISSMRLT